MDYFAATTKLAQGIMRDIEIMHGLWEESGIINVDKTEFTLGCYTNLTKALAEKSKTLKYAQDFEGVKK